MLWEYAINDHSIALDAVQKIGPGARGSEASAKGALRAALAEPLVKAQAELGEARRAAREGRGLEAELQRQMEEKLEKEKEILSLNLSRRNEEFGLVETALEEAEHEPLHRRSSDTSQEQIPCTLQW